MEAVWFLAAPRQGQGLADEARRADIGCASTHGTGDRLTCLIDQGHAASQRVAAKLGFTEFARTTYTGKPVVLLERPRRARGSGA